MSAGRLVRVLGLAGCALLLACGAAQAQPPAAAPPGGPAWPALTPAQREALAPLQRDWATIDANRKQKWLEVATRLQRMPEAERQLIQERMAAWARLSPAERTRSRLQFQEFRDFPAEEREAAWQAYQALPAAERQQLAQRAQPPVPATPAGSVTTAVTRNGMAGVPHPDPAATAGHLAKRNLVVPAALPPPRPVSPTVVQAKPGATTQTMQRRALPPAHNQAGLPKIAAMRGFVDPATLLPRRGPQGAAVVVDPRDERHEDPATQP